jgi:hypothetical protein
MRSSTFATASVVGVVAAGGGNSNNAGTASGNAVNSVNAAIQGCVNTCQPVLQLSQQCGFPVPANPVVALNPVAYGGVGAWGGLGLGGLPGVPGLGFGGWGGGVGGGLGGWKKRSTQGGQGGGQGVAQGGAAVPLNTAFLAGNWGGNWNNNLQCVCNTQNFNLAQVGGQCLTCVNSALNVQNANPCKFSLTSPTIFLTGLTPIHRAQSACHIMWVWKR